MRPTRSLTLLTAVVTSVVLASSSAYATTNGGAGTPMPLHPSPIASFAFQTASPGHAIYAHGQLSETDPGATSYKVHRLSDGVAVRDVAGRNDRGMPTLSSDSSGDLILESGGTSSAPTVVASDPDSGAVRWTVPYLPTDSLRFASGGGVLVARGSGSTAFLLRPGVADLDLGRDITGLNSSQGDATSLVFVPGSASTAVLVDLATGTQTTLLTGAQSAAVVFSPTRVFVMPQGPGFTTGEVRAFGRDGQPAGSFMGGPTYASPLTVGDAFARLSPDGIQVVDTATGNLEPPLVSHVLDFRSTGDGSVVVALDDVPDGRIAWLHPDGLVVAVESLTPVGDTASSVQLANGNVLAEFPVGVMTTPADGSGSWASAGSPAGLRAAAGSAILTANQTRTAWTLTAPGVSRTGNGPAVLGRGGLLYADMTQSDWVARRVSDGIQVGAVPAGSGFALDGTMLWTFPSSGTPLVAHGTDSTGVTASRTVTLDAGGCPQAAYYPKVVDHWFLVNCYASGNTWSEAVDADGVVPPLPLDSDQWTLGDGFLVKPLVVAGASMLRVIDLAAGNGTRDYGPSSYNYTVNVFGVDDGNAARFVYRDQSYLPRVVSMTWLGGIDPTQLPTAPTDAVATRADSAADVSWSAPASDGGSPISDYTVMASPGGATCTTTGALQCRVPGLTNGSSYLFTVTATNGTGTGPASSRSASIVPAGLPSPPGFVQAKPRDASADVSWSYAAGHGSPVTGYTVTASPGGAGCSASGPGCTVTGLANGTSYTFTVTATNGVGTSDPSSPSNAVIPAPDTTPPSVTFTSAAPSAFTSSKSVSVGFSGSDPDDASGALSATCTRDGVAAACASPYTATGLADGGHTFSVQLRDPAGNVSNVASTSWTVDTVAPTVSMPTRPAFGLPSSWGLSWSGTDARSGVANYDVRYARAAYTTGFGAWAYPGPWQHTSAVKATLAGVAAGYDYCFAVRSRDKAGNVSGWSANRCTARPLDDRALAASTGWTRASSAGYYGGTYTTTSRLNATLTRTGALLGRVGLVATTCASCGKIGVYVNGALLRTVNLYSATTHRQVIIGLPTFSYRKATIVLKVLTSGKTVQIDGLGLSRT